MNPLRSILRLTRPLHLLLALLTYTLGLGIARYLGVPALPLPEFIGGAIVLLLLAASGLLTSYFRPFNEPLLPGAELTPAQQEQLRAYLLAFGAVFLGVAGLLVFLLYKDGFVQLNSALLLIAFTLLALAHAVPPVRLVNRGFGELVNAYLIASLTPTLAYFLQAGNFHRLLTLYTFPLFLTALACFLALDFSVYADDLKYERRSLLMALSWQQAVPLHNLLLIAAYFFLACLPFFGVSFGLVWPALLTLPLAAYQLFALRNIAEGARPLWTLFNVMALAIFGLTAYLMALTFWLG
jgi:1,4-dihydroxy-2-naphthoate octaprenyltransferase